MSTDNQQQPTLSPQEEMALALKFIEETGLYTKFLIWIDIEEEIRKNAKAINESLALEN